MRMDHYSTLGVSRTATPDEIKKAYRKLAMEHHPDKGGDVAKFQEITTAYETLSDAAKRQQYDNPTQFSQHPGGFSFNVNGFDLNDLFGQVFGGNPGFGQRNRKQIFRTTVTVSLVDAYNGIDHVLQLALPTGTKVINITVPKGVETGHQIRYDDVIENASLIVEFQVLKDLRFDRQGHTLIANYPISVLDLIAGTKVPFKAINGKTVEVNILPKTQPSQHIRLSGLGMPFGNTGQYGDQILLLKPFIPDNIHTDIIDSIKRNQPN